jgi:hypothetical protein
LIIEGEEPNKVYIEKAENKEKEENKVNGEHHNFLIFLSMICF